MECVWTGVSYLPADRSYPVLERTVGDALRSAARAWGGRAALIEGFGEFASRRRWSFQSLLEASEQVARALLTCFTPGQHVAICAANCPEWTMMEFGAALAGLVLVTANPASSPRELGYLLRQSRASGIVVQPEHRGHDLLATVGSMRADLPGLRHVIPLNAWPAFMAAAPAPYELPPVAPGDIAQIQYTSGTTGAPKGAMLTHRGLSNNGRFYAEAIGARPQDVWINPMPMFHTAGCGLATLGALQTGGSLVMAASADAAHLLDLFQQERGTIMLCVPTMLLRVMDHPAAAERDLSSWRLCTLGGAPVAPDLVRRAQARFGLDVGIGFGQTEASPYVTHTRPGETHPDWITTVGRPLPQTEIKVVDPASGQVLPVATVGEVLVRGYGVMQGYFDNEAATAAALDVEGWLHTGDLGSIDRHGYCRIQGRLKEMIIRGGENIYPREVEDILLTHPGVANAAVIGLPDPHWGEVVAGFVRLQPHQAPDVDALVLFCRRQLAAHKVPRVWHFVDEFPQTASGKIQKFLLREEYLRQPRK
ncbi:MAG: AMP-binding protein [Acetobacteraceae bacterium]